MDVNKTFTLVNSTDEFQKVSVFRRSVDLEVLLIRCHNHNRRRLPEVPEFPEVPLGGGTFWLSAAEGCFEWRDAIILVSLSLSMLTAGLKGHHQKNNNSIMSHINFSLHFLTRPHKKKIVNSDSF